MKFEDLKPGDYFRLDSEEEFNEYDEEYKELGMKGPFYLIKLKFPVVEASLGTLQEDPFTAVDCMGNLWVIPDSVVLEKIKRS